MSEAAGNPTGSMSSGKKVLIFGSYAPLARQFPRMLIAAISQPAATKSLPLLADMDVLDGRGDPQARRRAARAQGHQPEPQPAGDVLARSAKLKRLIRDHRPDVLIAYTIKPVVIGAIAGAAESVPKIVSLITGAGYAFTAGPGIRRHRVTRAAATLLYKIALRRSDWVVFQNPDDEAQFRELGMVRPGQKVCRINGSGVDLTHFAPTAHCRPKPSFLMVSRLLKGKGVREFGTAAGYLKAKHPDASVHLVGYIDSSPDSISEAELQQVSDKRRRIPRPASGRSPGNCQLLGLRPALLLSRRHAALGARGDGDGPGDHHHRRSGLQRDGSPRTQRLPGAAPRFARAVQGDGALRHRARRSPRKWARVPG